LPAVITSPRRVSACCACVQRLLVRVQPIWLSPIVIVSIDSALHQNNVVYMEMPGMAPLPSQQESTPSKDDPAAVRNASGPDHTNCPPVRSGRTFSLFNFCSGRVTSAKVATDAYLVASDDPASAFREEKSSSVPITATKRSSTHRHSICGSRVVICHAAKRSLFLPAPRDSALSSAALLTQPAQSHALSALRWPAWSARDHLPRTCASFRNKVLR
jgi:hypothetical protein